MNAFRRYQSVFGDFPGERNADGHTLEKQGITIGQVLQTAAGLILMT